jgi:DNA-binding MarR family transcriptional regulator
MASFAETDRNEDRIVLDLLKSLERDGERSQRYLAGELGIALGLVNIYLKRCVKKGLVKVSDAPARRYAYYLTPKGFSEKSRLTVQYLSHSFSFFRLAKSDCASVLAAAKASGYSRLVLAGQSDLAEVMILCAVEAGVSVVAMVDADSEQANFVGVDVHKSYADIVDPFDAVVVTDVRLAETSYAAAVAKYHIERVFAPELLSLPARLQKAEVVRG